VLREAGVIAGRREGKSMIYHLTDEWMRHLLDAMHQIFRPNGVKAFAAEPSEAAPRKVAVVSGAAAFARVSA
jgi:truncated hemoglobin YjbI